MASRFWVGGTGTWDAADTTHWAATSGGAGGQSVPGSADTVTFDGNSGGGTVTPNTTVNVQSITCGAFTGTLDFSVNNNDVTLTANSQAFNGSGTGMRTINLGDGTWTLTSAAGTTVWTLSLTTNLTFNANGSTIVFSGSAVAAPARIITTGDRTYNNVTLSGPGNFSLSGNNTTFNTLTIGAGVNFAASSGHAITVTTLSTASTSSAPSSINSSGLGSTVTISAASGTQALSWTALRDITFTGGATFSANNSFDQGHNSGITITAPSAGHGGVIGC